MARGNFYAEALKPGMRRDGSPCVIAHEVAYQVRSRERAMALLDAADAPGFVQYWSERRRQRIIVCERDADGSWWSICPYSGEREQLNPIQEVA